MIAAWMLFTLEVSALLAGAAWLAERALLAAKRPVRGVWMLAMIGAVVLPLAAWFAPVRPVATALVSSPALSPPTTSAAERAPAVQPSSPLAAVREAPRATAAQPTARSPQPDQSTTVRPAPSAPRLWQLVVSADSPFRRYDAPLLTSWVIAAALGSLLCLVGVARTWRERAGWPGEHVDGMPVLVSHDVGPALVGVLHYAIVVPRWVLELEAHARRLVVAHEREHARSFDPLLLAAGVLLILLAPWNVANWLLFRRLRLAVELDCDQRVLRAHPDPRGYGALLLDVAERTLPRPMPSAALGEYGTSLERRIRAMTMPNARNVALRSGASAVAAGLLLVAACVTPRPYASLPPAQRASRLASDLANVLASDSMGRSVPPDQRSAILRTVTDAAGQPSDAVSGLTQFARATEGNKGAATTESAESKRLREAVIEHEPATLGDWPRADSALILLFDADGQMVGRSTASMNRYTREYGAREFLISNYFPTVLASLEEVGKLTIDRGARGESLAVPLQLIWGRVRRSGGVPLPRLKLIPSEEQMTAVIRATHREVISDTSANPLIGALLYDTRGELLGTAAVRMTESRMWPDGQPKRGYEEAVLRKAFGSLLDSALIVQSGMRAYIDETTPRDGMPRLVYAVIMKWPTNEQVKPNPVHRFIPGTISWSSGANLPDQTATDRRLIGVVQDRVPQALGSWSRADSSVLLIFDSNDQLIDRSAGPLALQSGLVYLIDVLRGRMSLPPSGDFEAAGTSTFTTDGMGRTLDKPLNVIWGRLRRGAVMPRRRTSLGARAVELGRVSAAVEPKGAHVVAKPSRARLERAAARYAAAVRSDTSSSTSYVVLLFDARGTELRHALVSRKAWDRWTSDQRAASADPSIFRFAFGPAVEGRRLAHRGGIGSARFRDPIMYAVLDG